jgi:hypothetical protein
MSKLKRYDTRIGDKLSGRIFGRKLDLQGVGPGDVLCAVKWFFTKIEAS